MENRNAHPQKRPRTDPVSSELKKIASKIKQPALGRVDGRYPVYVILTTWQGLIRQYGEQQAKIILNELRELAHAITRYRQWDSLVFIPDERNNYPDQRTLGVDTARPEDPWSIKLSLADLDAELDKFGEMIGAVLIVGGPKVVPFHYLPNPVDDSDLDVPSDNPYATRDENYFIPEWSVGRIPGSSCSDPQHLLNQLQTIKNYHLGLVKPRPWFIQLGDQIRDRIARLIGSFASQHASYGYSAAIWRRASLSVFHPIGDPRNVMISPPARVNQVCASENPKRTCLKLPRGKIAYFNLHGLPDTDEWYGQSDPTDPINTPDFPLALRAEDIAVNDHRNANHDSPEIIFTEACYGGHILNKTLDEAIVLRFLAAGSLAVIGSTCISYGTISTPLIAADLLGNAFWHHLKHGQPAGEALRRAKIHLAREMNKRQGYLDGEDQKTLLSFILYGDPLAQVIDRQDGPKTTIRPYHIPKMVPTACDRSSEEFSSSAISEDVIRQAKQLVAIYLPGMKDAEMHFSTELTGCVGKGHSCPSAQLYSRSTAKRHPTGRKVVMLSKTVLKDSISHTQYARMTLDSRGKVIKLAVSR
jgi:hypothetical protein